MKHLIPFIALEGWWLLSQNQGGEDIFSRSLWSSQHIRPLSLHPSLRSCIPVHHPSSPESAEVLPAMTPVSNMLKLLGALSPWRRDAYTLTMSYSSYKLIDLGFSCLYSTRLGLPAFRG